LERLGLARVGAAEVEPESRRRAVWESQRHGIAITIEARVWSEHDVRLADVVVNLTHNASDRLW
jgi:hypothetical protein